MKPCFNYCIHFFTALVHFYMNMAIIFWLNVFGIETWLNFSVKRDNFNENPVKKKRFRFYSIYAWLSGGITTIPTILRNIPSILDYCNKFKQSKSCVIVGAKFEISLSTFCANICFSSISSLYHFICGYLFCSNCYDNIGYKFSNILRCVYQYLPSTQKI